MRHITILLCLLLLASCGTDDNILINNQTSFPLNEGEVIIEPDKFVLTNYESLFDREAVSAPLYRYIKGPDYSIYLGLLYGQEPEATAKELAPRGWEGSLEDPLQTELGYSCRQLMNISGSYVLMFAVSEDASRIADICGEEAMSNRFKSNQ